VFGEDELGGRVAVSAFRVGGDSLCSVHRDPSP
jgi:hypothetical protein